MPQPLLDLDTEIQTQYCIEDSQRDEQMAWSIAHVQGRLGKPTENYSDKKIAIVCLGPSLLANWQQLRDFDYIMTCSGAHKFLIERGIVPRWHVEVDPRPHKIELLGAPHPDVEYLCASACHPRYFEHLAGHDVKLWHVYNGDALNNLPASFPRGDWIFIGGSNVGMRAIVLARFLGFRKIELFGMDYSYPQGHVGEHAIDHPNPAEAQDRVDTIFDGVRYHSTLRMLHYAKEFFDQKDLLTDVKFVLHGTGLLQHMAHSGYKNPNPQPMLQQSVIGFMLPDLITDDYRAINRQMHESLPHYGMSGHFRADMVRYMTQELGTQDVLDYGCGKGSLAQSLDFPIKEYDPAIPGKDRDPSPADIVICSDVLEHIEPNLLTNVLGDLARCTLRAGYFVINTGPAKKTLPDGRNAHLIQQNRAWWYRQIERHFLIEDMDEEGPELYVFVRPKIDLARAARQESADDAATSSVRETPTATGRIIEVDGIRFCKINLQTEWRATSFRTKEPITIEWIDGFRSHDTFLDVGANIGVYSLYAAKRGIRTYAFEPESQNFALLYQNIHLNGFQDHITAYPLALSDCMGMNILRLAEFMPGSSCHQFGRDLDFKNQKTNFRYTQGSFSVTIDYLVNSGMIPRPTHIKVDVDGLEPQVLYGAAQTLATVQSLLVEINQNLPEHRDLVEWLVAQRFVYSLSQVRAAERKDGTFQGVAEIVFKRK